MTPREEKLLGVTRRHFLKSGPLALGGMALSRLAPAQEEDALAPRKTHFKAKAKNVIYLHMAGSPPHLDLFDYKPELVKADGKDCPDEFLKGKRFAFTSGVPKLLGSPRKWARCGRNGTWISDAIPNLQGVADDLCVIRSMNTDQFNHAPAELLLYTGSPNQGRPSMGSWVTYGLGSENQNLPGFVVLISSGTQPSAGKSNWGSGFLPSVYQGVQCRSQGDPVLYVSDPPGMDRDLRRKSLDALKDLNELQASELGNPETLTRIAQYELAYRMQMTVPEVMDLSKEPEAVIKAYGARPGQGSFANNCLLARRLVEKGCRFVQLFDWGWDFHGTNPGEDIRDGLTNKCRTMDVPVAALLRDLKQRGLLDETLVIWLAEFGRTPLGENRPGYKDVTGRDHHPFGFSIWMAGGGIQGGQVYGQTDDIGWGVVKDPVHINDLHATLLRLFGLDHEKLTYRFMGRDFRLTDVAGRVVDRWLA
jgi:hypothetical protein